MELCVFSLQIDIGSEDEDHSQHEEQQNNYEQVSKIACYSQMLTSFYISSICREENE